MLTNIWSPLTTYPSVIDTFYRLIPEVVKNTETTMASSTPDLQDVIDQADDPGGGAIGNNDIEEEEEEVEEYETNSIISEDWKYVTNNTRIVVLPDPRLTSLLSQEDDQSSTGTSDVQGEGLDELEYEYEPGIALTHMQFASQSTMQTSMNESTCSLVASTTSTISGATATGNVGSRSRCFQCGVDYESGRKFCLVISHELSSCCCFHFYSKLDKNTWVV